MGTIHYLANGHKSFPKERFELCCTVRGLQLDHFRRMRGWGWRVLSKMNLWRQDKDQGGCVQAFVGAVRDGNSSPIRLCDILEVSRESIEISNCCNIGDIAPCKFYFSYC